MFFPVCFRSAVFALGLTLSTAFGAAAAPGAHGPDGSHIAAPSATGTASPRVTATSGRYELVGIADGHALSIYIDRFDTNAPVTDVSVAVTVGDSAEALDAKLRDDGVYVVESEAFDGHGALDLVFSVTDGEGDDLLVGSLNLPEALAAATHEHNVFGELRERLGATPGSAALALGGGLLVVGAAGALAGRRRRSFAAASTAVMAAGAVVLLIGTARGGPGAHGPDGSHIAGPSAAASNAPRRNPDGSAFVPKPTQRLLEVRTKIMEEEEARGAVELIGRVIADPQRTGLVQSIGGGRLTVPDAGLARLGQRVEKGDVLAIVERPLPSEERVMLSEKVGEIDQLIAVAERKLERTRQLLEKNVAPEAQVRDAETELAGLRARRAIVIETRAEPEILTAPIDGIISASKVVPGQVVQAQDVLFEIVDPAQLWVEALIYGEADPASLGKASATVGDGAPMALDFRGFSPTQRGQATVVQFAIETPPAGLGIGQPVRVAAASGAAKVAMVLPREAVVRSANGEHVVWRHDDPENFSSVPVRIAPLDGGRVIVSGGIENGARIVTTAANLVNQIR
jgi:cobalt-zinc-cadmium efflux system membrane fusion protein